MKTRFVPALLLFAAACAEQPPHSAPPTAAFAAPQPAPVPAAAPSPPPPSDAQVAPGYWNVERARCSDLLGASDEDRAAAAMFYYGYLAARAGIHVIGVSEIDSNVSKVMSQCAAAPNLMVTQAFRQALGSQSRSR